MEGELVLNSINDYYGGEHILDICMNEVGVSVSRYLDLDKPLEEQLKDKKPLNDYISSMEEYKEIEGSYDFLDSEEFKYVKNNYEKLFDNFEYIKLNLNRDEIFKLINNNPVLLTKKIVLPHMLDVTDYDTVEKLMEDYNSIKDNIYVFLGGNKNYIKLNDCYRTIKAVKEKAESIKKLGLSPMETIMYAYDQVRHRVYTHEDKDESYSKSRDLSEILFGDKIVCVGYANLLSAILHYNDIPCTEVSLMNLSKPERGHARNVIRIKDDKYDIDGVYYFDATWDSRRKNETNEYLYSYKYFARTRDSLDEECNHKYVEIFNQDYEKDMYLKISKIVESGNYAELKPYINTINYMAHLAGYPSIIHGIQLVKDAPKVFGTFDPEDFMEKLEDVLMKYDKEIPAETMLKLLNNVRKIEFYQNPELYPYTARDMLITCMVSNWKFENDYLSDEARLFQNIFGEKVEVKPEIKFRKYGNESGLFKDIEMVRIAKVLSKVREKRLNN